jgi:hypothetical protein
MNPYRHEIHHLLRSKSVLAVAAVTVLAGTLGYLTIDTSTSSVTLNGSGFWYYSEEAYHVDMWAFDAGGNAVSGVRTNLTVWTAPSPNGTLRVVFDQTVSTNAAGEAQFSVPVTLGEYEASTRSTYPAVPEATLSLALNTTFELSEEPTGTPTPVGTPANVVAQNFYSTRPDYLILWQGSNGSLPTGDSLEACSFVTTVSSSPPVNLPMNCTGQSDVSTQKLGPLSGYRTTLPAPNAPSYTVQFPNVILQFVEIVNSTGSVMYSANAVDACGGIAGSCSTVVGGPGANILGTYAVDLGLFLPLISLLLVYWTYARPRLTGTLESELLVLDLGVTEILREPIPSSLLLPLLGGFVVAAVGFAGVVYLLAHTFRTIGPVLGTGIALLLLFALFWSELAAAAAIAAGEGLVSSGFNNTLFWTQFFAPAQFPALVVGWLTGLSVYGGQAGQYGSLELTGVLIAGVGLAWLIIPALATYLRAVTRD